ncbi:solute carrier family 22 member 6-like [Columba livia]|uniref:Solute carrier family 22 member 6-like n=1 Tax=Columba livia TaxID=8932 RepID=A0A2I0LI85_COLLI|nr:solute carrier family 22 member 6-like [Columba livia]
MTFAELLARLGGMGRFQVWYVASLAVPLLMLASHNRPQRCRRFVEHQWGLLGANGTNGTGGSAATEPCRDGWTYRDGIFTRTVVTEWDLVCEAKALRDVAQSIYMAGVLLGSILFGVLSDRYCMEWIPTGARAVVGTINGYSYTLGQFVLAGMAFASAAARRVPALLPLLPLLLRPFRVPCSERNRGVWGRFSTSFAYYGLAMDLQGFGVDVYVSQLLFAAVDVPAKLASAVAVMRGGRRVAQAGSLALAGGCILATMLVPNELQALRLTLAVIGKGALAASFNCAYIFTGELFPTAIRYVGTRTGRGYPGWAGPPLWGDPGVRDTPPLPHSGGTQASGTPPRPNELNED